MKAIKGIASQINADLLCCKNNEKIKLNPNIKSSPTFFLFFKRTSPTIKPNRITIQLTRPTWNDNPSSSPQRDEPYPQNVIKNCFIATKCALKLKYPTIKYFVWIKPLSKVAGKRKKAVKPKPKIKTLKHD